MWIGVLAVIGIVYGALVAMVQPDMKKLVAYSSVSHLGFVMLGIAALNTTGVEGAVYQMLNHGVSTGALFFLVGVVYERRHTRLIAEYGGLWKLLPVYATCFLVVMLSSIGLPGLNGFVGEFLILMGGFRFDKALTAVAASGVVLGAAYMLWMYERVMFGEVTNERNLTMKDMTPRELVVMLPLIALAFMMGVYPKPFFDVMHSSVAQTLSRIPATALAASGHEPGMHHGAQPRPIEIAQPAPPEAAKPAPAEAAPPAVVAPPPPPADAAAPAAAAPAKPAPPPPPPGFDQVELIDGRTVNIRIKPKAAAPPVAPPAAAPAAPPTTPPAAPPAAAPAAPATPPAPPAAPEPGH
jgi:hypothetical protein